MYVLHVVRIEMKILFNINLILLVVLSIEDIIKKKISAIVIISGIAISLAILIFYENPDNVISNVFGMLAGMVLLFIFCFLKVMGVGDGIVIIYLGMIFGAKTMICTVLIAIMASALYTIIFCLSSFVSNNRFSIKRTIPFVPFILCGFVITNLLQIPF